MKRTCVRPVVIAALLAGLSRTAPALPIRADLLVNEKLTGSKTFCLSFTTTKPSSDFIVHAFFPVVSSGFLEVNGKRVLRWRNAPPKSEQKYETSMKSGVVKITIGVDAEVMVDAFNAIGFDQDGVTEIKELDCH